MTNLTEAEPIGDEQSDDKAPTLASVERALAILQVLGAAESELSAKEIMLRTGLRQATTFRFLSVLCRTGFLMRDATTGLYSPGFAVSGLSNISQHRKSLIMMALPTMRRCRDQLNETVYLSVLANDHRIDIEQVEAHGDTVRVKRLGQPKPLYASGPSRLLLALSSDRFIADYLRITPLVPFSENTLTTPEQIWDNINSIRQNGYAEGDNELNYGGANASAPIYGRFGEVLATITATASKPHYTPDLRERTVKVIVEAGREISASIQASGKPAVSQKRRRRTSPT